MTENTSVNIDIFDWVNEKQEREQDLMIKSLAGCLHIKK